MPYIKLLTALTALALLTACGGATPTAKGDPAQTTDCAANPFGASCIAEDINVEARITDCITAGNAGDTKCASLTSDTAMNTAINTCLTNPFDESCTASDFTFSTYAEMARVNRVSFCGMTGNAGNALCTALTTCQANPFGATCGAYFESAKNPYCETNPTEAPCVNTADWVASFTGGDALPTTPNATRKNEFLQATTTGFNTGANTGIREFFGNPTTDIAIQTLTFAEADTATGGVAFFGGEHYNNGVRVPDIFFHYAGVLAGTDLGAPITEIITTAVRWDGEIRVLAPDTFAELSAGEITDFVVDITFDGTEGEITSYFTTDSNTFYYSIDGKFDANGIITGDVAYANGTASGLNTDSQVYSPGTLTGIIGQNGAVGAFISGHKTLIAGSVGPSFSGGFVAVPPRPCVALGNCPVNHATWLQSFTTELSATPTRQNKFIQGTADGFNSGDYDSTVHALNFNDVFTDGNMTDGFAYFNAGSHVAIFSGTDLGAALPLTQRASVEWSGFIRSSVGFTTATAFSLTVGFTGTGGTLDALIQSSIGTTLAYDIDGEFDAKGVITGNVIRGRYASSVSGCTPLTVGGNPNTSRTCFNSADGENITATLSGIIGAEGAVGVFQGGTSYAGGFVAKPQ